MRLSTSALVLSFSGLTFPVCKVGGNSMCISEDSHKNQELVYEELRILMHRATL